MTSKRKRGYLSIRAFKKIINNKNLNQVNGKKLKHFYQIYPSANTKQNFMLMVRNFNRVLSEAFAQSCVHWLFFPLLL
jgi:lipid II:glycine glycyltransferase (peptidoglycan interpeptide bridge formation enzyme)